jgi:hypothetical protein
MFKRDLESIRKEVNDWYWYEKEINCLYELIKHIYHNTHDINAKNNIEWCLKKCKEMEFLQDKNKSYSLGLYSELLQRENN